MRRLFCLAIAAALAVGTTRTSARASHLMFVGTYTGPTSQGIYAFRFDDASGALTPVGLVAETPSPSFLAISPDKRTLFAVNEVSSYGGEQTGSVTSFAIDPATGKLKPINTESSHGADPCHLAVDATGHYLAVANYTGGTFAVLPIGANGKIGPATSVLTNTGSGPNHARQDGPHAHEVVFDASNRFLIGADLGLDKLLIYKFDPATGAVTPGDPSSVAVPPGAGPRHFVFHPTQPIAFSINELDSTVTGFTWDRTAGRLTAGASMSTLPAEFSDTNSTAEIALHPSGRFLYASNRGHDSIAVFSVGAGGALHLVEIQPTRGRTPRSFTIDPAGHWLLAANQDTGNISVFRINLTTGALSAVGPLSQVGSPVCLLFFS
jgi:6-phosphogluconolactonase